MLSSLALAWTGKTLQTFAAPFKHATLTVKHISQADLSRTVSRSAHISDAAYLRLLIPNHLTGRVIYLGTDVLVRHDIHQHWSPPLGENVIGAVRDSHILAEFQALLNPIRFPKAPLQKMTQHLLQLANRTAFKTFKRILIPVFFCWI